MTHSDCSYPSTDESSIDSSDDESIDSSDDENFRRIKSPGKRRDQETTSPPRRGAPSAARHEASFVRNVCLPNGAEENGEMEVPPGVPHILTQREILPVQETVSEPWRGAASAPRREASSVRNVCSPNGAEENDEMDVHFEAQHTLTQQETLSVQETGPATWQGAASATRHDASFVRNVCSPNGAEEGEEYEEVDVPSDVPHIYTQPEIPPIQETVSAPWRGTASATRREVIFVRKVCSPNGSEEGDEYEEMDVPSDVPHIHTQPELPSIQETVSATRREIEFGHNAELPTIQETVFATRRAIRFGLNAELAPIQEETVATRRAVRFGHNAELAPIQETAVTRRSVRFDPTVRCPSGVEEYEAMDVSSDVPHILTQSERCPIQETFSATRDEASSFRNVCSPNGEEEIDEVGENDENYEVTPSNLLPNSMQQEKSFAREKVSATRHIPARFVHNVCFANGAGPIDLLGTTPLEPPPVRVQENSGRDLKFYQEVIVPLLKLFGWEFCPLKATFILSCGSSTIRISTDALIKITRAFEEDQGVDIIKKECLIGKLEEQILLTRTKAMLDLQSAIAESCVVTPTDEDIRSTTDSTLIKHKFLFPTASRKRSRVAYEENTIKESSPQDDNLTSIPIDLTKFVSCRKVIPKYTTNTLDGDEIFPPSFVSTVIKKVFEDLNKPLPPLDVKRLLNVRLSNDHNDPLSLIIQAKGRDDLVDNLLKLVAKRVTSIQAFENVRAVLEDKKSLEIDVKINATEDLGLKAVKPFGNNRERPGIWIASTSAGGQFQNIFGVGTNRGAVLMKIGNKSVFKLADKNRILAKAKSTYEESGKRADKWISVTVCLNRNANLEFLDHKRVIFINGRSIRYSDGTIYQGKWKIQPPLPQNQLDSSIEKRKSISIVTNKQAATKNLKVGTKLPRDTQRPLLPKDTVKPSVKIKNDPSMRQLKDPFLRRQSDPCISSLDPKIESNNRIKTSLTIVTKDASKLSSKSKRHLLQKQLSEPCLSSPSMEDELDNKPKKRTSYEDFKDKIHVARDIEYKYAMIHGQAANGSMWNQHKLLFGEICEKDCPCVSRTKELTKNVVADFISVQKDKDSMWSNPSNLKGDVAPVGFMSSFCPKFFDIVKQTFSEDTPAEIMGKLVVMWKEHTKERRFGLTCRDECPCGDSWVKTFLPACGKFVGKGPNVSNHSSTRQKRAISMVDDVSGKEEFAITFNPTRESFGFYCETRKEADGTGSSCIITSLNPGGVARRRDSQIRIGTIVESSEALANLGQRLRIGSHNDLRVRYDTLKRKDGIKTRLRLYFRNIVTRSRLDVTPGKEWTERGAYAGKDRYGWAGGAAIAPMEDRMFCKDSHSTTLDKIKPDETRACLPKKLRPLTDPEPVKSDPPQSSHPRIIKTPIQMKTSGMRSNIELKSANKSSKLNLQQKAKPVTSSQRSFQDQNQIKPSRGKHDFADKGVVKAGGDRHLAFLKRAGVSIPKTCMTSPTNVAPTSLVRNSSGESKANKIMKEKSSGNGSYKNRYSTTSVVPPIITNQKQRPTSILKRPGGAKVTTRVTFSASVIGGGKHKGNTNVQPEKKKVSISNNSTTTKSSKSSTRTSNGQDSTDSAVPNGHNTVKEDSYNQMIKYSAQKAMKTCDLCQLILQEGSFSKTQWKKHNGGKCKNCLVGGVEDDPTKLSKYGSAEEGTDNELKQCNSCALTLEQKWYSNKQWRNTKISSRRCKKCISDGFVEFSRKREKYYNSSPHSECLNSRENDMANNANEVTFSSSFFGGNYCSSGDMHNVTNQQETFASGGEGYSNGSTSSITTSSGLSNLNDISEEFINVALYSRLEDIKSYIELHQPSGTHIAPALSAVKKVNSKGIDDELKKKAIVLKIYSNIFYILDKARNLQDNLIPSSLEYKEDRKMILKELHEKATWIEQFQKRERERHCHTIIDGNIKITGGFTMLHAAVILSDPIVTTKIMAVGAFPMAKCDRWGSVIDLSCKLQKNAIDHDDKWIGGIQDKINLELVNYQRMAFGG